jgi:phytoene dehydrogenase-like protein
MAAQFEQEKTEGTEARTLFSLFPPVKEFTLRKMPTAQSTYDVVILGAGHNGLVAAAYLAQAGLRVLVLEKNEQVGGAATSKRIFPDYDARISRYAYLVSLLPEKIIRDLGLRVALRTRATASFSPYCRDGTHEALLLSNQSEAIGRESMSRLTGDDGEFKRLGEFYHLSRIFADKVWDTMLQPLPAKAELARDFANDPLAQQAWRSLVEEPLGAALERYLENDLVRGLVFTDAKIGLLTHPHDETLLQNRCFLYHVIGNRTGEWKVPVGGMGQVTDELARVAAGLGVVIQTGARATRLDLPGPKASVQFERAGEMQTVESRFLLLNFGPNVLADLAGRKWDAAPGDEGSVLKINMLLRRLPRVLSCFHSAEQAFCGTFHIAEGYQQMQASYRQAAQGLLPGEIPCEVYCHTLTDGSILAPDLKAQGYHTLTLFALDAPWRLFAGDNTVTRDRAVQRCLDGLNRWLAEPIEECLAHTKEGEPCLEAKSPVDLEVELGHYRGNIFHRALAFPFADTPEAAGTWGVETEFENVFFCGASARRGGGVSGIPGHNAAMKVLECLGMVRR